MWCYENIQTKKVGQVKVQQQQLQQHQKHQMKIKLSLYLKELDIHLMLQLDNENMVVHLQIGKVLHQEMDARYFVEKFQKTCMKMN